MLTVKIHPLPGLSRREPRHGAYKGEAQTVFSPLGNGWGFLAVPL